MNIVYSSSRKEGSIWLEKKQNLNIGVVECLSET